MMLKKRSADVCNASILLYIVWLLIPAVQTTGRAMTGAFTVGLFAAGVWMDWDGFKKCWKSLVLRALCMAAFPIVLWVFLGRGGSNFAGFYVQQSMFWFPLVFAGYARERGDARLWRFAKWALLAAVGLTVCTTIGWLIQGMLRGGRVYAYSRSLGYGGEGREAYLKELMLRNIGGYDFVYAMVIALPITCIGVQRRSGWQRWAFFALLVLQTVMIVLSQYTYAMLFAAAILAVELLALILRKLFRLSMGKSLLLAVVPLVGVLLFIQPLVQLAAYVCHQLGLSNFAFSFEQLLSALRGQSEIDPDSRLVHYLAALGGIKASPVVGSLFTGAKQLSYHSEVLDMLSGLGLLGTAAACGMMAVMGRGLLKGIKHSRDLPQLCVMAAALFATALLGTVFYSRDILCVAALGTLLILENGKD